MKARYLFMFHVPAFYDCNFTPLFRKFTNNYILLSGKPVNYHAKRSPTFVTMQRVIAVKQLCNVLKHNLVKNQRDEKRNPQKMRQLRSHSAPLGNISVNWPK